MAQSIQKFGSGVGGASSVTLGDAKSGFQTADHSGWIRLDGRLKTSLTTGQQAVATSLGFGTNLPDAAGRVFVQGTVGALLGASTIAQNQLPNVALTTQTSVNVRLSVNVSNTPRETNSAMASFNDGSSQFGMGNAGATSSMNGGVAQQAYMPAAIGVNQFVYLGL
jgi:hypothetical protein